MVVGAVMIFGALSLAFYNHKKDQAARENSNAALSVLESMLAGIVPETKPLPSFPDAPEIPLPLESEDVSEEDIFGNGQKPSETPEEPTVQAPTEPTALPFVEIDGVRYIGVLEIPSLGLTLPVLWEWEDALMDIGPCRYAGDLYDNNMIVMAHNYAGHFGHIFDLVEGDPVYFTTVTGKRYTFAVTSSDVMHRRDVEDMFAGDWDLTLFTCVPRSYNRIAVRCELIQ